MLKNILIITMLLCLIGFATACDKSNNGSGGNPPEPKDADTLQNGNPLVGEWYEVGSTKDTGTTVIFTAETVTAFYYYKDGEQPLLDFTRAFRNSSYTFISENEIHLSGSPDYWTHQFAFHNDTLVIRDFINTYDGLKAIYLLRKPKDDDTLQNGNLFMGTWYGVNYKFGDNMYYTGEGIKVVFTDSTVTALTYDDTDTIKLYDNIPYTFISKNTIQLSGFPDGWCWQFRGIHISIFIFRNDTLVIRHFIPTYMAVPYPANVNAICLLREYEGGSQ